IASSHLPRLQAALSDFGLQVMAGPGGGVGPENANPALVPGASVGVSLVRGDVDVTGIGTLTYRRGNRIVAFGHPMMGLGALDAPMTPAYVHGLFPSIFESTKMASPLKVVGRIFQDRFFSVGGEIGKLPKMVPVEVQVYDTTLNRHKTFHIQVINH